MRNEAHAFNMQPQREESKDPWIKDVNAGEPAKILPFPKKEKQAQPSPYSDLCEQIYEIKETYLEGRKRRYSSLFDSEKVITPMTEEMIEIRKDIADDIIDILPNNKNNTEIEIKSENDLENSISEISTKGSFETNKAILQWIKQSGPEGFSFAENVIAKQIEAEKAVSFKMLALLGEMQQISSGGNFPSKNIVKCLEFTEKFPHNLQDRLAVLNRLNNNATNFALHKILDFLREYEISCQSDFDGEYTNPDSRFSDVVGFFKDETGNSKNYLIAGHVKDLFETAQSGFSEKKGAISGLVGGGSDEGIFVVDHLMESYKNRVNLGINSGYSRRSPIIRVAPKYLGLYSNGKIEKIYPEPSDNNRFKKRSKELCSKNDPKDEYFYDEINEPLFLDSEHQHDSNKLEKLREIWNFEKHLKSEGRKFFFDISKLDIKELHPVVVGDLMARNQQYLHEEARDANETAEIPQAEYLNKIFLTGKTSEEQLYDYLYLTKLDVRKRVEDDFGIDFGELNFASQRNFLNFLETRSIENVAHLQQFVRVFGSDGIQTFISCEYDLENAKKILELGKSLSIEAAKAVFSKYGEIVENVGELELLLEKYFKQNKNVTQQDRSKITDSILLKGKDFLMQFSERLLNGEKIKAEAVIEELECIKSESILFVSIFKTLAKNNPNISFEDFKGLSFEKTAGTDIAKNKNDTDTLFAISQENNCKENETLQNLVQEGIKKGLSNENAEFYILRKDGEPIAFCRFDDCGEHYYWGSVNVDKKYRGSAMGEVMMHKSLDKKAQEKPVQAHVDSMKDVASKYFEVGFICKSVVIVGEEKEIDKKKTDNRVFGFFLERNDQKNENYVYRKNVSVEQIKAIESQLRIDIAERKENRKEIIRQKKPFVVSFEEKEREKFFKLAKKLSEEYGYVITRYIFADKKSKFYAAFEQGL